MRRLRVLAASVTLATVSTGLGTGTAAPAEAAVPDPGFQHYVALGDSFSAGPLIPHFDNLECARSTNNYPKTLAVKLGVYYADDAFADVTCSAADTSHMTARQPGNILGLMQAPQFDALRPDTDLVTLGIGGNDETVFGDLTGTCPGLADAQPQGTPCRDHFTVNGKDTMLPKIARTQTRVRRVVEGIKERSPHARIVVVGYPRLAPTSGTCETLGFTAGDARWTDGIERRLNGALATAARDGGATFVDTYAQSLGHDICAGPDAWVQGRWTDITKSIQFHPLRAGMDATAGMVYRALNGTDLTAGAHASASSFQNGYPASNATDGDPYTRWASYEWADDEWLEVDLGRSRTIRRLELNWEYAYAKGYRIEASSDGLTWRTVWTTSNGDGAHDSVKFAPSSARYVRLTGFTRGTRYGISLHDFEIYDT